MNNISQKIKETALSLALEQALNYLSKNPEENIPKVMELVDKVVPEGWFEEQRNAFRTAIERKDNWHELIIKVWNLDENIRNAFLRTLLSKQAFQEAPVRNVCGKAKDAMSHGQFFWIPHLPVICTVQDVGLPSTEIDLI